MKYTYELFDLQGNRFFTTTAFRDIQQEIDIRKRKYEDFFCLVYNNIDMSKPRITLKSKDDFDSWEISLERDYAWQPNVKSEKKLEDFIRAKMKLSGLPDANLKTAAAVGKPVISSIPPIALFALGAAMQDGVIKYEKYNWRDAGATVSIFFDAMARHLLAWYAGEDYAKDSKIHHLAHLMAGCAIMLDSTFHQKLNDDRKAGNLNSVENIIDEFMKVIKDKNV